MSDNPILRFNGGYCMGDVWTLTNFLLTRSMELGQPVTLSRKFPPKPESKAVAYDLMDRIAPMLDCAGSFRWTEEDGTMETDQKRIWGPPHGYARLPLKPHLLWDGGSSGRIALQLNGVSGGQAKNPPPSDMPRFLALPNTVQIGLPHTLEESIAIMRTCRFMIASCSGMSHVAHACRIPLIIIEYHQLIRPWHPAPDDQHSPWFFAKGTDHALAIAHDLLRKTA